uniref:Uncharacterized protein n=1 Tax=Anaerolinea thermolimosa TaxID=229919 RepID=A0A7C4PSQ0_9CHLR
MATYQRIGDWMLAQGLVSAEQLAEALEALNPNGHIAILAAQEALQKASAERLKGMRIEPIL